MTLNNESEISKANGDSTRTYFTRAIGRKRVALNVLEVLPETPYRRRRKPMPPLLESVPQDVLIRILCHVNHSDVSTLFAVSKKIREAALIAKKIHFDVSTPLPVKAFNEADDEPSEGHEVYCAPRKMMATKSIFNKEQHNCLVVRLFAEDKE